MERVNIFEAELRRDADDPEGYSAAYLKLAPEIGARTMAGTV
jgi:hypothetical protein